MKSNKFNIWYKIIFYAFLFSAIAAYLDFMGSHYLFGKLQEQPEKNLVQTTANLIKDIKNTCHKEYKYIIENYSARNDFVRLSIMNSNLDQKFIDLKIDGSIDDKRNGPFKKIYYKLDSDNILVFDFGPPLSHEDRLGSPPIMDEKGIKHRGPPPHNKRSAQFMLIPVTLTFIIMFFVLTIAAVIFVALSKRQASAVKEVMHDLKSGNLKSRITITKFDEMSELLVEFNSMADEIEKLVLDLKERDLARQILLQELGHDLRTPIASVKSMLETNLNYDEKMTQAERGENLKLSLKEIDYFHHLVEDLLFLSGVHDLKYTGKFNRVNLAELISHEVQVQEEVRDNIKINFVTEGNNTVFGDEHLLQRLFRNAISNGMNHAKKELFIYVKEIPGGKVEVRIEDDGNGFNTEDLQGFGKKRATRRLNDEEGGRISIGLGSVIMNKICNIHHGELKIKNRKVDAEVIGASLRIYLNLSLER